jgi:hypothetical protein
MLCKCVRSNKAKTRMCPNKRARARLYLKLKGRLMRVKVEVLRAALGQARGLKGSRMRVKVPQCSRLYRSGALTRVRLPTLRALP